MLENFSTQHTSGGDLLGSWKVCMGNLLHTDWVLAQELQVRLVFLLSGVGWTQVLSVGLAGRTQILLQEPGLLVSGSPLPDSCCPVPGVQNWQLGK